MAGTLAGCEQGVREQPPVQRPLVGEILCLSMHFPLGDSDAEVAERTRQLDHAEALGVRVVRRDIHWHRVQPVPDEWHWDGQRTVTAVWTVDDTEPRTVRVPVGEGQVSVLDLLGEPVAVEAYADGVEIPATYLPHYVVEVGSPSAVSHK